jgi:hypothetical protein
MNGLPVEVTQSWFVVKAVVALSPMLTFWAAGVIGWFLRRMCWRRLEVKHQSGRDTARDEHAAIASPRG